jgi:arabinan endo-1,5-alpha-L-arabinosidase
LTTRYLNPVYKRDFADPGILVTPQGFYAYGSQGMTDTGMHNVQVAFSTDAVHWQALGDALPQKSRWADDQDYWAPHPVYKDGTYYLFYNAKTNDSGQGIGVATGSTPEGPFLDSGSPLVYGEQYANIDAFVFHEAASQTWWLVWGSCHQPIKMQALDSSLLRFATDSTRHQIIAPEAGHPFACLHEAAWIHPRIDPRSGKRFYYLFTSGADAFGLDSYGIMAARSETLTGPYETLAQAKGLPDSVILRSSPTFLNPGAHSMFTDASGQDWLLYHAYLREGLTISNEALRQSPRLLMLDPVYYDEDGWPYVKDGRPSETWQTGPMV